MLYDFHTQKWSEWVAKTVGYQYWSKDSRYMYYDNSFLTIPLTAALKSASTGRRSSSD
jgi:hypothetical protein